MKAMNVQQRIAAVAAVLFLGLAVWAAFVPTHSHDDSCGTWVSPKLTDDVVAATVARTQQVVTEANALGSIGPNTDQLQGITAALLVEKRECDSSLSTRKTLTWVGIVGALVVPIGILFIAGGLGSGRRELEVDAGQGTP